MPQRMYISGEGPNLLLHIALIKQWKASGQTDGSMKNWDFQTTPCKRTICAGSRLSFKAWPGSHCKSDVWCLSDVVLYTLNAMRATSIVFETSSAQKGGHFILRQYMWDFSGWSDLSAVKWRNHLTFAHFEVCSFIPDHCYNNTQ